MQVLNSLFAKCPIARTMPFPLIVKDRDDSEDLQRFGCKKARFEGQLDGYKIAASVDCYDPANNVVAEVKRFRRRITPSSLSAKLLQLALYYFAVEQTTGKRPSAYLYLILPDGSERRIDVTKYMPLAVALLRKQLRAPVPLYKHVPCRMCQYRQAGMCRRRDVPEGYIINIEFKHAVAEILEALAVQTAV
ncbi:MAG: hypothetical protein QXY12_03585 [Pyrobaculum sp.]